MLQRLALEATADRAGTRRQR